jgi:DNA-binding CsgD family transcriptional regulator
MDDLLWNARLLGAMQASACLTEEESIVLNDWAHGRSIANTAMNHNMSTRKVDRIRKRIRLKYDNIQPYENLPPRKKTNPLP